MRTLTIDRLKWARGKVSVSTLLGDDGKMCCLGFDCIARGIPESKILNVAMPFNVEGRFKTKLGILVYHTDLGTRLGSVFSDLAAGINDAGTVEDVREKARNADLTPLPRVKGKENLREAFLTELFYKNGTKLTFVN